MPVLLPKPPLSGHNIVRGGDGPDTRPLPGRVSQSWEGSASLAELSPQRCVQAATAPSGHPKTGTKGRRPLLAGWGPVTLRTSSLQCFPSAVPTATPPFGHPGSGLDPRRVRVRAQSSPGQPAQPWPPCPSPLLPGPGSEHRAARTGVGEENGGKREQTALATRRSLRLTPVVVRGTAKQHDKHVFLVSGLQPESSFNKKRCFRNIYFN